MSHQYYFRLTQREEDVFRLLVSGKTYSQIASDLYIGKHTAREYIARLYRKFQVHSRSELISRAVSSGVLLLVFKGEVITSCGSDDLHEVPWPMLNTPGR